MKASKICGKNAARRSVSKKLLLCVIIAFLFLSVLTVTLSACNNDNEVLNSLNELTNKSVATITGTIFRGVAEELIPGVEVQDYKTVADEVAALMSGKVKAIIMDQPVARNLLNEQPGLKILPDYLKQDSYGFAFSKTAGGTSLCNQISEVIKEFKTDGTLAALDEIWFGTDESKKTLPTEPVNRNGVVEFYTDAAIAAPFDFIRNGEIVGYDIHLLRLVCQRLGYGLEVHDLAFDSLIAKVKSDDTGMTIAGAAMSITEERKQTLNFCEPIYTGGVVATVLSGEVDATPLGERIKTSFHRTFVEEQRYLLIFKGLGITILITVLSAIFGTLLATGICAMRKSKSPWLNVPATIYIKLIQGIPVLVLLMILMFVIFAKSDISGVIVAVIGFSINFSAYVGEMMRTSLASVNPGETEAAYAMGFSKPKAFFTVTVPQAARSFLPVFKGEFVSMLKMTSIVGYIAVMDLTRAGDMIRGRTYEAFFPLIVIALIYLVLSLLLTSLMSLVEFELDPMNKNRLIKGVKGQPALPPKEKKKKTKAIKKVRKSASVINEEVEK